MGNVHRRRDETMYSMQQTIEQVVRCLGLGLHFWPSQIYYRTCQSSDKIRFLWHDEHHLRPNTSWANLEGKDNSRNRNNNCGCTRQGRKSFTMHLHQKDALCSSLNFIVFHCPANPSMGISNIFKISSSAFLNPPRCLSVAIPLL